MKSLFGFLTSCSFFVLVVVTTVSSSVAAAATVEECDRCNFDGNDPKKCKDYGLIDNSILIGWNLGSDQCLEEFNIKITTPDPTLICASSNSFVNELRFGTSLDTAKLGLGVASGTPNGGFYNDGPTLKDEIIIDGSTINCKESESNCYNAMKPYFESDDGKGEMDDVCNQLSNKVATDKQLEQSTLRNRLCLEYRDGTTIPTICEPLWSQLLEEMNKYPDKGCQGFAFGTQNTPIPGCDDANNSTTVKSTGSSANTPPFKIINVGSLLFFLFVFTAHLVVL